MKIDYSIVVPVYKSVDSLRLLSEGVKDLMASLNKTYEIIFVEDRGSDESWQMLLALNKEDSVHHKIVKLSRNFGQNGATLCGINLSEGESVLTLDDDLQVHPRELIKLIEARSLNDADVVYGMGAQKNISWIRKLGSKWIKRIIGGKNSKAPVGSSVRLISKSVLDSIKGHSQDHLFINQIIGWYTIDIVSVDVEHDSRHEGKSGYNIFNLIFLSLRLIIYYTSIPIKIMIFLSILTAFCIFLLTGYYIYYKLDNGQVIDLFMISVLFSMAIIAASISVFGVYINRIYSSRVSRPVYAIKIKK